MSCAPQYLCPFSPTFCERISLTLLWLHHH